ncbi:hypothetical protein FNV43_RR21295 [Rhamnella rubrinervis]|uniref:RRM domain-containing protein n=1 Tax=Rhamnella rubrinervis TaxID=2594499 RepID=A0A8K0E0G9_9ROSA|nr:hypothetical protein FNV43_RR21295 [Rhamnella rubrinervis]
MMERTRLILRSRCSGSTPSDESAMDLERNGCSHLNFPSLSPPALQPFASAGQHCESNAAYFSWPTSSRLNDAAEERANYFANLQKGLGTAIGFRIRRGLLTDIPAILVFVSRKVHKQWLSPIQCLPTALEGPGGVWCDVDVVEFSYFGAPEPAPKEQLYTEIVDDLRGGDPCIGSGSQVASQETYGTLGAIVRSQTGNRQVGFLTNRHVAVDLDYPNQKMFHPLPPTLGPGVYLGAVERATSFITDELWYGIFAGINPETFVRADGAFIPFADDFDLPTVTTSVRGVGEIGDVKIIDLQSPISSLIGKQVMKVGRSSGLTNGTVLAYALEYNDEKGICFLTDFLVVGENQQTFDLEGDSGSLIILKGENGEKPRPFGIIWGGTANRGRLKLKVGQPPENWTSGVDLGRLLSLLELDLITTEEGLKVAVQEQRTASATAIGRLSHIPLEVQPGSPARNSLSMEAEFHLEDGIKVAPSVEHQFISSFTRRSPLHQTSLKDKLASENLSSLRNGCDEDICVSLQLGTMKPRGVQMLLLCNTQLKQQNYRNFRATCIGFSPTSPNQSSSPEVYLGFLSLSLCTPAWRSQAEAVGRPHQAQIPVPPHVPTLAPTLAPAPVRCLVHAPSLAPDLVPGLSPPVPLLLAALVRGAEALLHLRKVLLKQLGKVALHHHKLEKLLHPKVKKASPINESLVLHIDALTRNVHEGHLKEIFSNFGEVVHVELAMDRTVNLPRGYGYVEFKTRADAEKAQLYMDGAQIDGNVVRARFTLPQRQKVSPPPKAVSAVPKRDVPKTDNASADKDGPKRPRESSPRRKPPPSPRRRSPVARRGGSPRRLPDSPPRRRAESPARRRVESPYRRGDTPPRRRLASPPRGRSSSPPPRRRSPARASPRRMRGSPVRRRSPLPPRRRSPPRRARSPPRRSPISRRRSRSPIRRPVRSRSRSISPRRGRGPGTRRGRSSSYSGSPSPRKVTRRVSRSPRRPLRGRSSSNSSSSSSPPRKP